MEQLQQILYYFDAGACLKMVYYCIVIILSILTMK